jgi:hypothetical protein
VSEVSQQEIFVAAFLAVISLTLLLAIFHSERILNQSLSEFSEHILIKEAI